MGRYSFCIPPGMRKRMRTKLMHQQRMSLWSKTGLAGSRYGKGTQQADERDPGTCMLRAGKAQGPREDGK